MKRKKDVFRKIKGIFFILLSIVGAVLPILPGFIFFFLGLSMLNEKFSKDLKKSTYKYKCHKSKTKYAKEVLKSTLEIFKKNK